MVSESDWQTYIEVLSYSCWSDTLGKNTDSALNLESDQDLGSTLAILAPNIYNAEES